MKIPVPVPSLVFVDKDISGFGLVDHITPRSVIVQPPSDITLPPLAAVLKLILLITLVFIVGKDVAEVELLLSIRQRTENPNSFG
jgi:hypothetical protein